MEGVLGTVGSSTDESTADVVPFLAASIARKAATSARRMRCRLRSLLK